MALSESIICTVRSLLKNKDDRTATSDIYKHLYNYYTSSDIIDHYYESMKQLDKSSLDEEYQWIIFDAFHITTNVTFYNFEFRDKLCHVWLPIYESTLKELLSTQYEHEHLNSIKYIISNMIEMQQTFETKYHIIKRETQFENFNQKSQYFKIIKLVLPLLINPNILKQIENDHQNNIQLKWKQNNPLNTLNATPIYTLWIILKLIIMFIKTNEDCLTSVKHDQNIKNILLKSIKLIKDDNPLKLSIYTNLALLLNEDDIKNELDDPKEIIIALVANFKKGHYSVQENSETTNENEDCNDVDLRLSTNGVHIIDILAALRGIYILMKQIVFCIEHIKSVHKLLCGVSTILIRKLFPLRNRRFSNFSIFVFSHTLLSVF